MSMARSKATNDDNNQLTFVHKQLPAILQLLADEQGAVSAARCVCEPRQKKLHAPPCVDSFLRPSCVKKGGRGVRRSGLGLGLGLGLA